MIDKDLLQQMIDEKYVNVTKHPTADLYIYNYTAKAQYDKLWNEVTLQCRGLILDGDGNVVAIPFRKFFNLEEHDASDIPNLPFEVYEKLDGSMFLIVAYKNQLIYATRGSFVSEQAIKGKEIFKNKYANLTSRIEKYKTYIFEVIYPENRIVVEYPNIEDIILLSIIDNKTGVETLENIGFTTVKKYDGINDYRKLKDLAEDNKEGFVIKFSNNFRVKVKFDEYIRLHRILTGVSNIAIWEYLKDGNSLDELLDRVPDEFYDYVKRTKNDLEHNFQYIEYECVCDYKEFNTRKETALYFQTKKYPSILFAMLDKRDYAPMIWKLIRPTFQKPFKQQTEC